MKPIKITTIEIQPQTNVRSTKGDSWLFAVSDEYLADYDAQRADKKPGAKKGRNLNRKRQLEKYNSYKEELRWLAEKQSFVVPDGYFVIWFCIPFPKSWLRRKKKCAEHENKPHQSMPDCDNMIKAFLDALVPRKKRVNGEKGSDDRRVHSYAAFKIWVKPENACIRIAEYNKDEFLSTFL